jgi:acyl-CoA thioesterase I
LIMLSKLRTAFCVIVLLSLNTSVRADGTILVFGDSISAAYGMSREQGWVNLLAQRLKQNELEFQVVNASISGETTGGGLVRLPKTLEIHQPDLVILELGGNDGLRGYPIDKIQSNLQAMTQAIQNARAKVLIVGMVLPPNYGKRYTDAFEKLFDDVAQTQNVPLLPFVLEGIATSEDLIQRDGIHPKPEAQPMMLDDIWPHLEQLIR